MTEDQCGGLSDRYSLMSLDEEPACKSRFERLCDEQLASIKPDGKPDRRYYLSGPYKGQRRPSKQTRERRAGGAADRGETSVQGGKRQGNETVGCATHDSCPALRTFRLLGGVRETRSSRTVHPIGTEMPAAIGGAILRLDEEEEVLNGRRWFRERYPADWYAEYEAQERRRKASTCLHDYGQEFVEFEGRWYEAREITEDV